MTVDFQHGWNYSLYLNDSDSTDYTDIEVTKIYWGDGSPVGDVLGEHTYTQSGDYVVSYYATATITSNSVVNGPTTTLENDGSFTVHVGANASSAWAYAPPITGNALFNVAASYLEDCAYVQPTWNNSILGPNFHATSSSTSIDWGDGTAIDSSEQFHQYVVNEGITNSVNVTVTGTEEGILTTTQDGRTTTTPVSYTQQVSFALPVSDSNYWSWQSYTQSATNTLPAPSLTALSSETEQNRGATSDSFVPTTITTSPPETATDGVLASVSATTNGQGVTVVVSANQASLNHLPDVVVSWGDGTSDSFSGQSISTTTSTSQSDDSKNGGLWEYDTAIWNVSKLHTYAASGVYQVTISVTASAATTGASAFTLNAALTATVGPGESSTWINAPAVPVTSVVTRNLPTSPALRAVVTSPITAASSSSMSTTLVPLGPAPSLSVLTKTLSSAAAPTLVNLPSSTSQGSSS
ncbi:MAG: hypothetical protein P4L84_23280 [Isosphaeraceae bacterium]|nr:hypothetical protein [Isosphaeraceae bacterium]